MIVVSDSDILSMFGKVSAVQHLKRLFKEIEEKDNTRIKGFEEVFEL